MQMGTPQVIQTETGEELIILTRRDYDALLAQAGDEEAEDRMTVRLAEESRAAIARGEDVLLPEEVWEAMENGQNRVRVLREHRGLTADELAQRASLSPQRLTVIESGGELTTVDNLKALARELAVPLTVLTD
jgi:ribosome-binding protein aMBF1 (putative translation factor)